MRLACGSFVTFIIFRIIKTFAGECAARQDCLEDYTSFSEDYYTAFPETMRKVMPKAGDVTELRRSAWTLLQATIGRPRSKENAHGDQTKRFAALRQGAGRLVHRHSSD